MSANQTEKETADGPITPPPAENAESSTDDAPPPPLTRAKLPPEIEERLADWQGLWVRSSMLHYCLGTSSVFCSAFAATIGGVTGQYLAATAAVLTAVIGFVQPQRRYFKFVNAWRVLDAAALRYKYCRSNLDNLFAAVDKGEQIITEYESKAEQKPVTTQPVE